MKLALILGDQLSLSLPSLRALDPSKDQILMAEVGAEANYVAHHKQKIALIFSAMRHFADSLMRDGWHIHYHTYDAEKPELCLSDIAQRVIQEQAINELVITHCGEYRLQHAIESQWQEKLGVPIRILADDRFIVSLAEFNDWAKNKKQLRMENFYREVRRKTGLLMSGDQPVGEQWNFDAKNRKRYQGEPPLPPKLEFQHDAIDHAVLRLVEEHFPNNPGRLDPFLWGTKRSQALQALDHFIQHRLKYFGDFQDAMVNNSHDLFHSLLSPYLNCGLLTPKEVCKAAEQAYRSDLAPLNCVEGFIRQIIGWREYVRGIYWLKMPDYATQNSLQNSRDLPNYYWTGNTRMQCMQQAFQNTFDHAYAHHIQRLMVTGNFALLAGIKPSAICEWYLAVYADAYDWVELPNTLGMVMHADGGFLGSKPYAASGNYINKMSDYCQHCEYNVKTGTDHDSCPFNSLYWHFIDRHRTIFSDHHRMRMIYASFDKMDTEKRKRTLDRAEYLLENLDDL